MVINRKYLQRIIDVTANVAPGKDLGGASQAVQRVLDELPPPEGFTVRLGGQTEAQQKAFGDLSFAAVLAILLVYMVLASQFKSLIDPLVIMFSVPLGVTGVFMALWLTGTTLSVNSFMGIIMMVGIVVSNGVLLVDFANVLRWRGKPLIEATIDAGRTRLRPILMTTVATIVGLIPMALGIGEGSETNLPLARAVIGGLTVSTVFTLFLVPALYTALERFSKRSHAPELTTARRVTARMREVVAGLALGLALLVSLAADAAPPAMAPVVPVPPAPALAAPSAPAAPAPAEPAPPPQAAPEKVTLGAAVQRALERNPSVAVAVQEIERADALITQARAGWFPTLNGQRPYTRLDHDRRISSTGQIVASGEPADRQPAADRADDRGAGLGGHPPRQERAAHRRGERRGRAPAGRAVDGARLPDGGGRSTG